MKFCTNCGKALSDDAAFCTGCGKSTGNTPVTNTAKPAESAVAAPSQQPAAQGAYAPNSQGGQYYQAGAPGAPGGGYTQPGVGPAQNQPYYQNAPYGGGPSYPGGGPRKNNKTTVVIVSVIIGLALIGGGIFAYFKLSDRNNTSLSSSSSADASDSSATDALPSEEAPPSEAPSPSITDATPSESAPDASGNGLSIFDVSTQDNIIAACEEIGMDVSLIADFEYYGAWNEGEAYTFTYDGSVIDLLLYEDDTVFSIETGGVQVYLHNYEAFSIDDNLGSTTHFDESYPANGYVFYTNRGGVDSTVTFEANNDYDYVVELINQSDNSLAIAFYVRAGMQMSLGVLEGDYIIQYAAGESWQGVDSLFGADTLFYRSDSIYAFYPENESTITFDLTGGSGIPSSEITIDDF